ncbi:MAG: GNAT family N-acetyltransferase [Bacteroidetes bacterium]|nr:GNAT family N-acetyltransferase [Bacteroidota bacterium]
MNPKDLHIETERLLIRPYTLEDAPAIKEAIDSSLPELLLFMPWAKNEPQGIDAKKELIKHWTKEIEEDKDYTLGIFDKVSGDFIGSTGIHTIRSKERQNFHIGYWCHSKHTRKGYITESSRALTDFGFNKFNAERMEIHCEESNIKSAAIPKRLGYNLEGTFRILEKDEHGNRKKHQAWYMFKEEWKG